jgi:steroid delta-isomerase-like uncharacterized protein
MVTSQTGTVRELAQEYFELVNRHDVEGMSRYWDDNSVDDFVVLGPVRGRAELAAFFHELFAAIPDGRFHIERITADSDTAAVQYRFTGTFTGEDFRGIRATGKRLDFRGADIVTFEGEILRYNSVYYDGLTFVRQIGMMPDQDTVPDRAMRSAFNALTELRKRLTSS